MSFNGVRTTTTPDCLKSKISMGIFLVNNKVEYVSFLKYRVFTHKNTVKTRVETRKIN